MATRKTTKTAAKTAATTETDERERAAANQRSAQQRVQRSTARAAGEDASGAEVYGNANTETQKAAAGYAQTDMDTGRVADPALGQSVQARQSRIQQAVAEQRRVAEEAANEVREADKAAVETHEAVMNNLEAPLRAPTTNAMQAPREPGQVGVHPDVTSPTNLMAAEQPALPGTGVADPRDLAPGQDMSPSPPVSSSNILPQPDKPGTPFSKL